MAKMPPQRTEPPSAWLVVVANYSNSTMPEPEICDTGKFAALKANTPFLSLEMVLVGRKKVLFPNASSFTPSILESCCPKGASIGREDIRSMK
jgi:hypothetical protein